MPFTPFHLGPALALGLPLRKYIHPPTFILASVAVDVEPLLVLYLNLSYPLHGYLHTLLLSSIMGVALGCGMFFVPRYLHQFWAALRLEKGNRLNLASFVIAGASGAMLHVFFDSPLYSDIHPLYPLAANPMYNPQLSPAIYSLCVWMGIIGIVYYAALIVLWARGKPSKVVATH